MKLHPDDADLERLFPHIRWREPVIIHRTDGVSRYGCRFCIALYGLAGKDVPDLPGTHEEWENHMDLMHAQ